MSVRFLHNGIPSLQQQLPGLVQRHVEHMAEVFRQQIISSLESGAHGLSADTGTYGDSLYIQTPHGSDYDARIKAAGISYLQNPSLWREPVREHFPDAYTASHFLRRTSPEVEISEPLNTAIAVVATFWAVAFYWEFGHNNEFTGKYEHRPVMGPEADMFFGQFVESFQNLFDGVAL